MDNTQDESPVPINKTNRLNNFEHRSYETPHIEEPKDLITGATPAQKERLVYLIDDAIDVIESTLESGSEKVKLAAAQDIMDRAGLPKNTKTTTDASPVSAVPAEVFTEFVAGLAKMFNVKTAPEASFSPRDVTPSKPSKVSSHSPSASSEKKKTIAGLPESFLNQYKE